MGWAGNFGNTYNLWEGREMSGKNEKAPFEVGVLGICGECSKMYAMETFHSGKLLPCGHSTGLLFLTGPGSTLPPLEELEAINGNAKIRGED